MTDSPTDEAELMQRFGITSEPARIYHYKDWKYSNLKDAIAQARRDAPPAPAK